MMWLHAHILIEYIAYYNELMSPTHLPPYTTNKQKKKKMGRRRETKQKKKQRTPKPQKEKQNNYNTRANIIYNKKHTNKF